MPTTDARRLDIHAQPDGSLVFRDADAVWGIAPSISDDGSFVVPDAPRVVLRVGSPVTDAESALASWSNAGWAALGDSVALARDRVHAEHPLAGFLIWPQPGCVLSDAVSTLTFARTRPDIGLVLDPVSWLAESMRPLAEDHLARFVDALAPCASLACVIVRPVGDAIGRDRVGSILAPLAAGSGFVAVMG